MPKCRPLQLNITCGCPTFSRITGRPWTAGIPLVMEMKYFIHCFSVKTEEAVETGSQFAGRMTFTFLEISSFVMWVTIPPHRNTRNFVGAFQLAHRDTL